MQYNIHLRKAANVFEELKTRKIIFEEMAIIILSVFKDKSDSIFVFKYFAVNSLCLSSLLRD